MAADDEGALNEGKVPFSLSNWRRSRVGEMGETDQRYIYIYIHIKWRVESCLLFSMHGRLSILYGEV